MSDKAEMTILERLTGKRKENIIQAEKNIARAAKIYIKVKNITCIIMKILIAVCIDI